MNTGTIKLGNFIKLVIGILAGVLFLFLMFGANVRNTATSASIGENNRMTGELSAEAYATQYFIPTQPCVDSIGLLLEFEPESVADGCVSVWLYDATGKVVAGCDKPVEQVSTGNYTDFALHAPVEPGMTYHYTVSYNGGQGAGPRLVYRGKMTAGPDENTGLTYGAEVFENGSAACVYQYSYPLNRSQRMVYVLFTLLAVALIFAGIQYLLPEAIYCRKLRVDRIVRVLLFGMILLGMAVMTYFALVKQVFGGTKLDLTVYALGIFLLGGYLLLAVAKTNLNVEYLYRLKTEAGIRHLIRILSIAYFVTAYAEYINSGIEYGHSIYGTRMFMAMGVFVLTYHKLREIFSPAGILWTVVGWTGFLSWMFLHTYDADTTVLYYQYGVLGWIVGIAAIRTLWNLIHKQCRRFSLPFSLVFVALLGMMIVFRNTRIWPIQMAVICGFVYLQPIGKEDEQELLNDICRAVMLSFLYHVGYAVMFRPYHRYRYNRYPGIYMSVASWGIFLAMVTAVFLVKLFAEKKKDKRFSHMWAYYLLAAVCGCYLLLSITRTAIVAATVLVVMLLAAILFAERHFFLSALRSVLLMFGLLILMLPGVYTLTRTVPALVDRPRIYRYEQFDNSILPGEAPDSYNYIDVGKVLSISLDRLYETFVGESTQSDGFFNSEGTWVKYPDYYIEEKNQMDISQSGGRVDIWKGFIKGLNMTGHVEMSAVVDDFTYPHAHNIVLQEAHDFGIPTAGIFLVFGIFAFVRSGIFARRNGGRNLFTMLPFAVIIAFVVVGMFEWIFHVTYPITMLLLLVITPLLSPMEKEMRNE